MLGLSLAAATCGANRQAAEPGAAKDGFKLRCAERWAAAHSVAVTAFLSVLDNYAIL